MRSALVVIGAFMNLFNTIRGTLQYFQVTWASRSGLVVVGERAHQCALSVTDAWYVQIVSTYVDFALLPFF